MLYILAECGTIFKEVLMLTPGGTACCQNPAIRFTLEQYDEGERGMLAWIREKTMTFHTTSPEETEAVGQALGKCLKPGTIVAYRGDLGAGKTAFTRGLARGLGAADPVTSPTYTIVNEYLSGRLPLFHFDMYRLASSEDLWDIGWEDYLDRGGVCCVEWSERVTDALGAPIWVCIEKTGEDTRRITIEGGSDLAAFSL